MPTKPTVEISTVGSQRDKRFVDTFHDQHKHQRFPLGRPFTGWREYSANPDMGHQPGFVTTDLTQGDHEDPFGSNWTAPWLPEVNGGKTSFYEFNYQRKRITIRYDLVIAHDTAALDRYYQAAALLASQNGWTEVEYGTVPRFAITAKIGLPPRSPKIAQAAQAGDPWLLGFVEEPNEALAKLLGLSTRGFKTPQIVQGVVTPEEVLATPPQDLDAMIADAVAKAFAAHALAQPAKRSHHKKRTPAEPMSA